MLWRTIVITLLLAGNLFSQDVSFKLGKQVGMVKADPINEASGLVASRRDNQILWTHDDGKRAQIFAIDTKAKLLAKVSLVRADIRDLEDIAVGPGPKKGEPFLYGADTGNNDAHRGKPRPFVSVFRFEEPEVPTHGKVQHLKIKDYDQIKINYPDSAHDVETMMVDPLNGDIYLCTKREKKSRVYRVPAQPAGNVAVTAEFVGELTFGSNVSGDVSPDGSQILIKDYLAVLYYPRVKGEPLWKSLVDKQPKRIMTYIPEPQGESICFDAEGKGFYTLSEARKRKEVPLFYYERND